jgi:hypothetical protein
MRYEDGKTFWCYSDLMRRFDTNRKRLDSLMNQGKIPAPTKRIGKRVYWTADEANLICKKIQAASVGVRLATIANEFNLEKSAIQYYEGRGALPKRVGGKWTEKQAAEVRAWGITATVAAARRECRGVAIGRSASHLSVPALRCGPQPWVHAALILAADLPIDNVLRLLSRLKNARNDPHRSQQTRREKRPIRADTGDIGLCEPFV